MKKIFMRAICQRGEKSKPGDPIRFVASTQNVARDDLVIDQAGWRLDNYKKNPVFLWVHDYWGNHPPIGKTVLVEVNGEELVADVVFDQNDEFARGIEQKYTEGFLNAVSVGWDVIAFQPAKSGTPPRVTEAELLDISAVPVPGDPDALIERQYRALRELFENNTNNHQQLYKAIPPHKTEKAAEDAAWDGTEEMTKAEGESQLKRMCAWVDEEGDPDTKQSYKLPHHYADAGQVVWRGVAAAMARLLQAGTQIPDEDREGVYRHLARHYEQFDKTAPEFRTNAELEALGEEEWRGMFLEGELEIAAPITWARNDNNRAGAVLSARNQDDLAKAVELIQGVLERAKKEEDEPRLHDDPAVIELLQGMNEKLKKF